MVEPNTPKWSFQLLPNTDFIGETNVFAFLFNISFLERLDSVSFSRPVYATLLKFLAYLQEKHMYSDLKFTIFTGEISGFYQDYFAVAFDFLEEDFIEVSKNFFLRSIAELKIEFCSTESVMPAYRYDQGYIIEYSEPDMAGTSYIDSNDNYSSNLKIYRRSWLEPEEVGLTESMYSQLEI